MRATLTTISAVLLITIGGITLTTSRTTIDSSGIIHEPLASIAVGTFAIGVGLAILGAVLIKSVRR